MQAKRLIRAVAWALIVTACKEAPLAPQKKVGKPMDPYIQLYQFTRDGNPISLARVIQVRVSPGPGPNQETVEVGVEITETLWRESGATRQAYQFQRPASSAKFTHPVWGRVNLEAGTKFLMVLPAGAESSTSAPVYADQFDDPNDPVLKSIRAVIETQRKVTDRGELFKKRLAQLRGGPVEKLFAGEALASEGPFRPEEETQIAEAFPRAFSEEKDAYIKISLGSWLWDLVYPKAGHVGRANTLNATIQAIGSTTEQIRIFALDRLAEANPKELREAAVKASPEAIRLLEDRHSAEEDADVRRHLEEIIAALRQSGQMSQ